MLINFYVNEKYKVLRKIRHTLCFLTYSRKHSRERTHLNVKNQTHAKNSIRVKSQKHCTQVQNSIKMKIHNVKNIENLPNDSP